MNLSFLKSLVDFSDGGNSDASTFSIKDSELALLDADDQIMSKNVRVDPLGPIEGRLGTLLLNDGTGYDVAAAGAINFPIKLIHRYYRQDGNHLLIMTANTRCFSVLTSNYAIPTNIPAQGGLAGAPAFANALNQTDVNVPWRAATIKDWVYFTSELARPRRTDGSFVYYVGEAPAAITTAPAGAGGAIPAGTYYYVLTRVYTGGLGESPISAEFSHTLGAPGGIAHTFPALERADQTAWRLYRSAVGRQGGPYFFVTQAAPGAFTDTLLEGALGSRVDTTRIQPWASGTLCLHQERLFLARVTESLASPVRYFVDVQFSDANAPDQFPAEYRLRFPNPAGEQIRAMASHDGVLYIFTMNYLFAIIGTGQERGARVSIPDYRPVLIGKGPGALSQEVVRELNGVLYFTNKRDIWQIAGGQVRSISEFRVRRFLRRTMERPLAHLAVGVATDTQYRVTYPKRLGIGGSGLPDLTLIYDVQAGAFIPDDGYSVQSYCYMDGESDEGELLLSVPQNFSLLLKGDTGNTDHIPLLGGTPIERKFRTKDFSFGRDKGDWVGFPLIEIEGATTEASVAVTAHLDRDRSSLMIASFPFSEEGTDWEEESWDEFDWARAGVFTKNISVLQGVTAQRIALAVVQDENQDPFKVERITFGGVYSGPRRIGESS